MKTPRRRCKYCFSEIDLNSVLELKSPPCTKSKKIIQIKVHIYASVIKLKQHKIVFLQKITISLKRRV